MSLPLYSVGRHFRTLEDPRRKHRRRHPLLSIVVIALCAVIANCDDWQKVEVFAQERREWLATFLDLPNGIPSHDTFERVFDRLDPDVLQRCLLGWIQAISGELKIDHIAIDGKTLRHSGSPTRGIGALHLVSAWSTTHGLSLGQVAVDDKSNEIKAIPRLLELLTVKGALVTIDAMGCQKEIAKKIVEAGGDYILPVKGNGVLSRANMQGRDEPRDGLLHRQPKDVCEAIRPGVEESLGNREQSALAVGYQLRGRRQPGARQDCGDESGNASEVGLDAAEGGREQRKH